jgi:hypothetical protein
MWFQKVMHSSEAVTWWKRLAVLAVHVEQRPCLFEGIAKQLVVARFLMISVKF